MKRASRVNRMEAARRATVRVCDENGHHRGQGLLLDVGEGEETVVLTCHHVVASLDPGHLFVAIPQTAG